LILAGISVTVGFNTKGGARNVGLATTQATVWTAITVIICDFFLTWIFFGTSYSQ
jgi:phospholipid/cholesterol/gamma-HCH transport system permease protein